MTPRNQTPISTADRRACDPLHPTPPNCRLQVNIAATDTEVTIFTTRTACNQVMGNTYRLEIKDDDTFIFYGDVSPATMDMLSGAYRAFMRLARYGFDREP